MPPTPNMPQMHLLLHIATNRDQNALRCDTKEEKNRQNIIKYYREKSWRKDKMWPYCSGRFRLQLNHFHLSNPILLYFTLSEI